MAIVFSSAFPSPIFDDWDIPPAPGYSWPGISGGHWPEHPRLVPGQGADGGNALACGVSDTGGHLETVLTRYLASTHAVYGPTLEPPLKHPPYLFATPPTALTIRASLAVFKSVYNLSDGGTYPYIDALLRVGGSSSPYTGQLWTYDLKWFAGVLYVCAMQGTVGCTHLPAPPFSPGQFCQVTTPVVNPFPLTGEQFSLQWAVRFTGPLTFQCAVAVNGVQICAGTVTGVGPNQGYFDYITYKTMRLPTCAGYSSSAPDVSDPPGVPGRLDFGNSVSYIEVDDQYAILPGFGPRSAPTMTQWLCWEQAHPIAVVGDVATNTLTATGTNFRVNSPGFYPQVQGPEQVVESFVIVSATDTEIVFGSLNPPVVEGGTYCVTIRNPCT